MKNEVKFQYLTEENLQKIEEEQSAALCVLAVVGILMMLGTVL